MTFPARHILAILLLSACPALAAAGTLLRVPTRPDVTTTLFWEPAPAATATVMLFPGGEGGFGSVENGRPTSRNFLVRSAPLFLARQLNVAIFGRPSDSNGLDYADRVSEAHIADVREVLEFVKAQSGAPIWLVGTSRGTISATAAAIRVLDAIAGLVLTSSVVGVSKPDAVPTQDLAAIKVPVLVMHHSKDACWVSQPGELPTVMRGLKNAPIRKLIIADGGRNPRGDPCGALHWHGFNGMEPEAVDAIASWIRQPQN